MNFIALRRLRRLPGISPNPLSRALPRTPRCAARFARRLDSLRSSVTPAEALRADAIASALATRPNRTLEIICTVIRHGPIVHPPAAVARTGSPKRLARPATASALAPPWWAAAFRVLLTSLVAVP